MSRSAEKPRTGVIGGVSSLLALMALSLASAAPAATAATTSHAGRAAKTVVVDHLNRRGVVSLSAIAVGSTSSHRAGSHVVPATPNAQSWRTNATRTATAADGGGATAPASQVVDGGSNLSAFNGISSIDMETGGTGAYANTNGTLEPPDQGVCSNGTDVIEAVNDSLRVYTASGTPLTQKSVPLAQFFNRAAGGTTGPSDFISDPRCIYDPQTQRWFVTILDLNSAAYPAFMDDSNFIAVSQTSDPMGKWNIFSFDVTDNGINNSPLHPGCVGPPTGALTVAGCLGDQPTIGTDRYGVYITDNEYAFAEVFPVAPPVFPPFQQIPVLRSGVAQLYALSKQELVGGRQTTLVRYDTGNLAFPGPAEDSPWQSISPASPVPNDTSQQPSDGAEFFLSSVGLPVGHPADQIVVWSWSNTKSLSTSNPNLNLQHTIIKTSPGDTFYAPDPAAPSSQPFAAYQKDGPHPLASQSGDPEEYLNGNDDRMNWVTESKGTLWTDLNTQLPATSPGAGGHAGEKRVGIMYMQVRPSLSGGKLSATLVRDGYVQVPNANVLFGSIGPRADGATVMTFSLAGINYFPSIAYARLDGLSAGQAPVVHVALPGKAPEDGFTGLGLLGGQGVGLPDVPPCGPCVARWGDYSASEVAPDGCVFGATEYIPTGVHDSLGATDWGTGVIRVCPPATASHSKGSGKTHHRHRHRARHRNRARHHRARHHSRHRTTHPRKHSRPREHGL